MKSQELFSKLVKELEAALDSSLERYSRAIRQGNLDLKDEESERQTNLVNARDQLQVLQNLWPRLVGPPESETPARPGVTYTSGVQNSLLRERPESANQPKPPVVAPSAEPEAEEEQESPPSPEGNGLASAKKRGRTQPEQLVRPILRALEALGGSGARKEVYELVEHQMGSSLTAYDRGRYSGGAIRWHVSGANARSRMMRVGLLAHDSPKNKWEITDSGRAYLQTTGDGAQAQGE